MPGANFLHVRLSLGDRIFALKDDKGATRFFAMNREESGNFLSREMVDLGTSPNDSGPPWFVTDAVPFPRDVYEDLTDSDEAKVLEYTPAFPDEGKVELYVLKPDDTFDKKMEDAKTVQPKVLAWAFRVSTMGKTWDIYLTKAWRGGSLCLAAAPITSTSLSIPVRDKSYIVKQLKLLVPGNWDNKTVGPYCPSKDCHAPGPHIHNGEGTHRCNTCGEEFEEDKNPPPRRR